MSAFFIAPRVSAGPAALEQLGSLGAQRAAVVVDPAIVEAERTQRVVEELAQSSAAVEVLRWDGPEPTVPLVDALAGRLRSFAPDWIVGVGGGRTLDGAKAAWVRYARPQLDLASLTPLDELKLRSVAGFVAVPSTSGSGCDVSWTTMVRSSEGRAIELASRELVPDWALLDPALPATMPPEVTVDTGAELIGHAVEAIVSEWANPFSDAFAREALATAFSNLPKAVRRPEDLEVRLALHHAASFAGLAASNAQFGAAHALAVALGPETTVSYGRLLGILLPYVSEFNYPSSRERLERASAVLGAGAGKDRSAVAERLRTLLLPLGIPRTLKDAGLPSTVLSTGRERVVSRARASSATVANPRVASEEEYARLLGCAFDGVAVMF
ncbi:MAG: iron-containing alcohol dehydrogenase [Thermoplasmata archaeon]|nr:iron-containing alcohol dehydrogenase [Thermoplasmata archaeon]MCI4359627.1 iron-containing alcohol dehydrogenase [Thermoplasmata archaeon]